MTVRHIRHDLRIDICQFMSIFMMLSNVFNSNQRHIYASLKCNIHKKTHACHMNNSIETSQQQIMGFAFLVKFHIWSLNEFIQLRRCFFFGQFLFLSLSRCLALSYSHSLNLSLLFCFSTKWNVSLKVLWRKEKKATFCQKIMCLLNFPK